jgi:hypothetical protein
METGLLILLLSMLIMTVSVLNFQTDPFIAYTIVMAKLIGELGSSAQASAYLSSLAASGVYGWQTPTSTLLQSLYGAGVLLAVLHLISGVSIIQLTYLPIPGIVSMCMVYLILGRVSNLVSLPGRSSLVFSVVAILSMYSYMAQDTLGRFYAFDFHAINNALYLMCLYFIIRLSEPRSSSSYFLTFILAFTASNIIHFTVPVTLIGDLAAYLVVSWLVSRASKIRGLLLLLVVISTLQSAYFTVLQTVNIQKVSSDLIQYFSGGFLEFAPVQGVAYPYPYQYQQLMLAKAYTYSAVIFVVVISVALFRMRGRSPKPLDTAYFLAVGGGITLFFSYFAYYGYGNFGFIDGWLLQPLLFLPITFIWTRQKLETRTKNDTISTAALVGSGGHDLGNRRRASRLALFTLLVLALLLAGSFTLDANGRLFYGPFVSEPGLESANLQSFSIEHLSSGHFLIGSSIEVSSSLYARLADYGAEKVLTVIPVSMVGYSTLANNTIQTYGKLRHDFNYLILTKYELTNGLHGDVLPDYVNAQEVVNVKAALDSNQNLVYNSGQAYLYELD